MYNLARTDQSQGEDLRSRVALSIERLIETTLNRVYDRPGDTSVGYKPCHHPPWDETTKNLQLRYEVSISPNVMHQSRKRILDVVNELLPSSGFVWDENTGRLTHETSGLDISLRIYENHTRTLISVCDVGDQKTRRETTEPITIISNYPQAHWAREILSNTNDPPIPQSIRLTHFPEGYGDTNHQY
jgi:hypothetical protein